MMFFLDRSQEMYGNLIFINIDPVKVRTRLEISMSMIVFCHGTLTK